MTIKYYLEKFQYILTRKFANSKGVVPIFFLAIKNNGQLNYVNIGEKMKLIFSKKQFCTENINGFFAKKYIIKLANNINKLTDFLVDNCSVGS